MVLSSLFLSALSVPILLAHGADPRPLQWDEALANLVKFAVTFLMVLVMSYPVLAPLFRQPGQVERPDREVLSNHTPPARQELVGWLALGLVLILGLGWWLARSSLIEVMTEEDKEKEDHAHTQTMGGQVAMWGDFHAEVARIESGEVRIYLRDSYNRDIASRYFDAEVKSVQDQDTDRPEETFQPTQAALNESYRFVRLGRDAVHYKIKVSTPGWTASLKFDFDGTRGRRSLPLSCTAR